MDTLWVDASAFLVACITHILLVLQNRMRAIQVALRLFLNCSLKIFKGKRIRFTNKINYYSCDLLYIIIFSQIAELTKTWAGKWEGYQNIIEVCNQSHTHTHLRMLSTDTQDSNLALHSEGIKMIVASEMPHFLAVDDHELGTGVVIYRLQVCSTYVYVSGTRPTCRTV